MRVKTKKSCVCVLLLVTSRMCQRAVALHLSQSKADAESLDASVPEMLKMNRRANTDHGGKTDRKCGGNTDRKCRGAGGWRLCWLVASFPSLGPDGKCSSPAHVAGNFQLSSSHRVPMLSASSPLKMNKVRDNVRGVFISAQIFSPVKSSSLTTSTRALQKTSRHACNTHTDTRQSGQLEGCKQRAKSPAVWTCGMWR